MKNLAIAAAFLLAPAVATAQSQQDQLDTRYDRALAAGYKALFTCSAIATAELNGAYREEADIAAWELTGIQQPFNDHIADLASTIYRGDKGEGALSHVSVEWSKGEPPRLAYHTEKGGCSLLPIGTTEVPTRTGVPHSDSVMVWSQRIIKNRKLAARFKDALGDRYGEGTRTTAVLVSEKGQPLLERYNGIGGPFTPQRTWSVAKSIAATLVGAAVHRGEVKVTDSAGLGEDDSDPRRAITIDHALRMATGRYSDTPGNRTDPLYFGGATVDEVALDWPLINAPGAVFRYANNDTLAAVQAIEPSFDTHPPAEFFKTVGMGATIAETDWQGNYILSSQVWSTGRDLMKLGQLYLDDGVLPDGTRILPEGWARYVATPSGPQPEGRPFGYGAGFWLFNNTDGVPPDTYAALGNRGQHIVIVPSRNVVIVRRGEDPVGSRFDIAAFTRDVLAALEN